MKKIFATSILLAIAFIGTSFAQTRAGVPSTSGSNITELDINGLKVLIKRRPGAPTVSAGLYIRGGVGNYSSENSGIEEMTLQAMAEGSVKFPQASMRRELSRMGSSVSGTASYDYGVFAMASTNENFSRTWELFSDSALRPAFETQSIEVIRERILTVLRTQSNSPDGFLDLLSKRVSYRNHPYSKTPLGNIDTIGRFKESDLRRYHTEIMRTSQLLLIIVGDVQINEIASRVEESFGRLPKGSYKNVVVPELAFARPSVEVISRPFETTYVRGVFSAPNLTNPDYYAMRVAISYLQMLVYQEVRTARNLSYAPDAEMDDLLGNSASIYVTSTDVNQAVSVMLDQIKLLKRAPLGEDQISGVPNFFLTTYYIDNETNAAQNGELARYELLGRGWRDADKFISNISAVTPQDIQRVALKYMNNIQFVIVGNQSGLNREIFLRQ